MDIQKPYFLKLDKDEQKVALEALIFASDTPLSQKKIFKMLIESDYNYEDNVLDSNFEPIDEADLNSEKSIRERFEISDTFFEDMIDEVNKDLQESGRPYEIKFVAEGYQFATRSEFGHIIQNLIQSKTKRKLSNAAMEVLSIIAYRQPVTKPEIETIRGVNSNEVVNSLVEKGLARICGKKDILGKPLMFGTTNDFLKVFGLKNLKDLPKLKDLEEIAETDIHSANMADTVEIKIDENLSSIEELKSDMEKFNIEKTEDREED